MRYSITCVVPGCGVSFNVGGTYEPDTNATVLDDNDRAWIDECCQHIQDGGDYEIGEGEPDEPIGDEAI